ncbi:MAG: hypothetical protein ACYDAO_09390 [Thermoplasmataceae archaeon]
MGEGLGRGILEIAMALIGVALVALLVRNSGGATNLVRGAGDTFNTLLQTVSAGNSGSVY